VKPIGDVSPSVSIPILGRQLSFDQLAHISERLYVITLGIFRGRGNGRDQFGRVRSRNDMRVLIGTDDKESSRCGADLSGLGACDRPGATGAAGS
jgi:hypothetical protein